MANRLPRKMLIVPNVLTAYVIQCLWLFPYVSIAFRMANTPVINVQTVSFGIGV